MTTRLHTSGACWHYYSLSKHPQTRCCLRAGMVKGCISYLFNFFHRKTTTTMLHSGQDTMLNSSYSHFLAVHKDGIPANWIARRQFTELPAEAWGLKPSKWCHAEPLMTGSWLTKAKPLSATLKDSPLLTSLLPSPLPTATQPRTGNTQQKQFKDFGGILHKLFNPTCKTDTFQITES